jgi:Uma2 family endonuclease
MEQMTKLVTADNLWNMPDHGGRNELVNGELRPMSPAGGEHGAVIMYIAVPMANHADEHDQGIVLASETGFILRRSPDTVRAADAAFVRKDCIPAGGIPVQFIPFAPNLAVEVMSPWDTMPELEEKVLEWLAAGTKLVWLVLPKRRVIKVYRSRTDVTVLTDKDDLDGEDVLPGFRLPVARIFR